MVLLGGILASLKSTDPVAKEVTGHDRDEFLETTSHFDEDQRRELKREATALVEQNWRNSQKLAMVMLLLADEDGDIQGRAFLLLCAYASDRVGLAEQARVFAALARGAPIAVIERGFGSRYGMRCSIRRAATEPPPAARTAGGERIEALTSALPSAVLHRPWSLEELVPRLDGKYRPCPATRSVAQALRRLGWQEQRCWKKTGLNRRLWVPPEPGRAAS
jgi:hypothetical protein